MIATEHLVAAVCFSKVVPLPETRQLDPAGHSCLHYAVHCGNAQFARHLVQKYHLLDEKDNNGRSGLAIAVGRNELKIVQDLLNAGADICAKDFEGVTPLHLATKSTSEVMKAVLSKINVHNVDIVDGRGRTALHWAAALAKEDVCRLLLQAGANTTKLDQNRRTPLHWLSISPHFEHTSSVARLFLRTYSDLVRWQDVRGATPFHLAACSGNVDLLATLLNFAEHDVINRADNLFRTPLHYSCALGHTSVTGKLIDSGANVVTFDCEGATPVHLASYWNHGECLQLLKDKVGPSVISLPDAAGLSPLHWAIDKRNFEAAAVLCESSDSLPSSLLLVAAARGDDALVDLLLSKGIKVSDELERRTSSTALIKAACHGHVTVMMSLVYRGNANPKQADLRGRTALHWAAMSGSPKACAFLLEVGCPSDAVDYLGCTALHCAAFASAECLKTLLKHLSVELKDRYGFTSLHWACLGRNSASAKLLLVAGSKVNALGKTRDRQTPLDIALRRNATEVAELLVSHGGMTAHGLRGQSATLIQSLWRGFRVRRTLKAVQRHELHLASTQRQLDVSSESPFQDGMVDAVYYGMGKNSGDQPEEQGSRGYTDQDQATNNVARRRSSTADEVAPPLVSRKRSEGDYRIRANSNRSVHFASDEATTSSFPHFDNATTSAASKQRPESPDTPRTVTYEVVNENNGTAEKATETSGKEKLMSMAGIAAVVAKTKRNVRRWTSHFGVYFEDDDEDEDEDLTPAELQQKYYRMTEEQIILNEAANARKLRVEETKRVEAVRARFNAACVIQRSWHHYKKNKKSQTHQKLTARQMRLRAGEHAWKRQMAAITLQNAWRKHHRFEVLKTLEFRPELHQVHSPMSSLMKSTRQAVVVSSIYNTPTRRPATSHKSSEKARPAMKPLADLHKPRPAAISFNFALKQYTSPVTTAGSMRSSHT